MKLASYFGRGQLTYLCQFSYSSNFFIALRSVHPRKLREAMWNYSSNQGGSTLHIGRVVKAILDESTNSIIQGVELDDGTILPADKLIVACGPWTEHARSWFPPPTHHPPPNHQRQVPLHLSSITHHLPTSLILRE